MTLTLGIMCGCLLAGGFIFFILLSKAGQRLLQSYENSTSLALHQRPAEEDK